MKVTLNCFTVKWYSFLNCNTIVWFITFVSISLCMLSTLNKKVSKIYVMTPHWRNGASYTFSFIYVITVSELEVTQYQTCFLRLATWNVFSALLHCTVTSILGELVGKGPCTCLLEITVMCIFLINGIQFCPTGIHTGTMTKVIILR